MMRTINWVFLIVGTIIMMFTMKYTGRSLQTPETPKGILNLEFAYTDVNANNVIASWKPGRGNNLNNVQVAIRNTWLDFIFLFFYSLFLFYSCKTIAESFNGAIMVMGKLLAMGALNAGLLDILENTGMLLMLNNISSESIAWLTTLASSIKWILALLALIYVVLLGPLYLLRLYRHNRRH